MPSQERLTALEEGEEAPSRSLLVKMAQHYRRPLVTFYLSEPPKRGKRGKDFRRLPSGQSVELDPILDALIRDVQARQSMVRSILEEEEEAVELPFVGSHRRLAGHAALSESIQTTLGISLEHYRSLPDAGAAFAYLRELAEASGVFVLLRGNLGSHHTALGVDDFRGFAMADKVAPFVVINENDSKAAWSFTLLHELAHIWLGQTGISGGTSDSVDERFCNDVASEILLPSAEFEADSRHLLQSKGEWPARISRFADEKKVSRTMVAYRLLRTNAITQDEYRSLASAFRSHWLEGVQSRRRNQGEGGPNYYVVKRHRVGSALVQLVDRMMHNGVMTSTRAAKVLGVKPAQVQRLLTSGLDTPNNAA